MMGGKGGDLVISALPCILVAEQKEETVKEKHEWIRTVWASHLPVQSWKEPACPQVDPWRRPHQELGFCRDSESKSCEQGWSVPQWYRRQQHQHEQQEEEEEEEGEGKKKKKKKEWKKVKRKKKKNNDKYITMEFVYKYAYISWRPLYADLLQMKATKIIPVYIAVLKLSHTIRSGRRMA